MTLLYGRAFLLRVGTIGFGSDGSQADAIHVKFTVKRTIKPTPNTLEIELWNLQASTRAAFDKPQQPIQLDAGYAGALSTRFIGTTRNVQTRRENGVDVITKITAGEGEAAMRAARTNTSLPKGQARPVDVLKAAGKLAGIKAGNIDALAAKFDATLNAKVSKLGKVGAVLSGSGSRQVQAVARSVGLEVSIQADKLQILERNKALDGQSIKVSPATGLVGSPTIETKGKTLGKVKFKSLMLADPLPGRVVVLESEFVSGNFKIEMCTDSGDNAPGAQDWYSEIEGIPY